jgi:signal transduction histidine kinase
VSHHLGKRRYRFEPARLNDIVSSGVQALRVAISQNGFAVRIAAEADLWVSVDRVALEQVFVNLLSNALKYSGERREIDVSVRRVGEEEVVEIRDYGVGFASEHHERIFERLPS